MLSGDGEVSRTLRWDDVRAADSDVLILACCGRDVPRILVDAAALRRRPGWNELRAVRSGRVMAIDGSAYFNRPGPRLIDTVEITAAALQPGPTPDAEHRCGGDGSAVTGRVPARRGIGPPRCSTETSPGR